MTPDGAPKSVHLQLPAELLAQIDKARKDSDVPRNAWIRRAIQQRLDRETPKWKPPPLAPTTKSGRRRTTGR